ncbi:hypothetical protein TREES_T100017425 [Tupaia chinensis]|uniref:Uncharacterized protein n=1 Tax=Tupaia chinensis TaxID=246437 RepID=L8YAQ8_TUPCH|nr:hypothetical protein TREES_T100017425 [Tupaia chinensis]
MCGLVLSGKRSGPACAPDLRPASWTAEILGLLSLQVLNAKPAPAAEPAPRPLLKRNSWNFVKCAYMVVTFLFTSYNKGDWVRAESGRGGPSGHRRALPPSRPGPAVSPLSEEGGSGWGQGTRQLGSPL